METEPETSELPAGAIVGVPQLPSPMPKGWAENAQPSKWAYLDNDTTTVIGYGPDLPSGTTSTTQPPNWKKGADVVGGETIVVGATSGGSEPMPGLWIFKAI